MPKIRSIMLVVGLASSVWFGIPQRALKRALNTRRPKIVQRRKGLRPKKVDQFSVVSWNVLAERYARAHQSKYAYPNHTPWDVRWPQIKEELQRLEADVVCLQEVEPQKWEDFLDALPAYEGIIQEKGTRREVIITNAVFYNPDKFTPTWIEHRSRAMAVALSWNAAPEQVLYVANLHLEGHPLRPSDRVNQLNNILRRMQAHQRSIGLEPRYCSVIITGDFNAPSASTVCRLLSHGTLEAHSTEPYLPQVEVTKKTLEQPYRVREAYEESGVDLPFTTKMGLRGATIDFIWATTDLCLDAVYWPFKEPWPWEAAMQFLPNINIPSDHVPIGAVFTQPGVKISQAINTATFSAATSPCQTSKSDIVADSACTSTTKPVVTEDVSSPVEPVRESLQVQLQDRVLGPVSNAASKEEVDNNMYTSCNGTSTPHTADASAAAAADDDQDAAADDDHDQVLHDESASKSGEAAGDKVIHSSKDALKPGDGDSLTTLKSRSLKDNGHSAVGTDEPVVDVESAEVESNSEGEPTAERVASQTSVPVTVSSNA